MIEDIMKWFDLCVFFYNSQNRELKFRLHDFSLRANVIKGDLIAANGIIHIIDQLLDKPPVTYGSTKVSSLVIVWM